MLSIDSFEFRTVLVNAITKQHCRNRNFSIAFNLMDALWVLITARNKLKSIYVWFKQTVVSNKCERRVRKINLLGVKTGADSPIGIVKRKLSICLL